MSRFKKILLKIEKFLGKPYGYYACLKKNRGFEMTDAYGYYN